MSSITDGTSNTALWCEGVSGTNLPVVAGSSKVSELRGFFNSGFSLNPNNLIRNQSTVYQFLAACNAVPVGTLAASPGNTGVGSRRTELADLVSVLCQFRDVQPRGGTEFAAVLGDHRR